MYRAGARLFGWSPRIVDDMYLWQLQGAMGLDVPESPEQAKAGDAAKARAAMNARAERLRNLDDDTKFDRMARMGSRAQRRRQQREDPAWREEVEANKRREKTPDPSRVIQAGDPEGDIVLVR